MIFDFTQKIAKVLKHNAKEPTFAEAMTALNAQEAVMPADGKKFTLKELQGFVSGYIEILPSHIPNYLLVCNEESKCKDGWELEVNLVATVFYTGGNQDVVAGDVLLVHKSLLN